MKRIAAFALAAAVVVALPALAADQQADTAGKAGASEETMTTGEMHDVLQMANGDGKQKCFSARHCEGKVLSNRDKHNCKVKSKGKSWMSASGACCPNL